MIQGYLGGWFGLEAVVSPLPKQWRLALARIEVPSSPQAWVLGCVCVALRAHVGCVQCNVS